jgi:hypothetical protein
VGPVSPTADAIPQRKQTLQNPRSKESLSMRSLHLHVFAQPRPRTEIACLCCTGKRLTRPNQFLFLHSVDLRVTKSEVVQRFSNSASDDESCEPLVIGRHYVPWRKLPRSGLDRLLKCVHIVVPVVTLLNIGERKLPRLLWRVEAAP